MANKKLKSVLKKYDKSKQSKEVLISGTLGIALNGTKIVEVPNRKGFVYVRIKGNTSELIQAFNATVSPVYDLPVFIVRQNNIYKIVGRNIDRYTNQFNTEAPYLPKHGAQHSFNQEIGAGGDVVWVYSQQFMPMLSYPSGSLGSMSLAFQPGFYEWNGQWKYAQNTGTPSYTPYLPTITGSARMVLSYLDPSDNSIKLVPGTPFSNSLTGSSQIAQYIPDIPREVGIPLAAVRLTTGTTSLGWGAIYDMRDFWTVGKPSGSSGGGGGGISGLVGWDEGISLGTGTILNVVGAGATLSLSGTVLNLNVTSSGSTNSLTGSYGNRVLIASISGVGTGTASFQNIPSGYSDLEIVFSARSTKADISDNINIALNNDTTNANYRRMVIQGSADTTLSAGGADDRFLTSIAANNSPSNSAGAGTVFIPIYSSTSFNKQIIMNSGYRLDAASTYKEVAAYNTIEWESNAAVSRVDLILSSGNYATGTVFKLYGNLDATQSNLYNGLIGWDEGIPVASGTILNVTGQRAVLSASGTVLNLTISPDPFDNIGAYITSNGVPLGTGTTIDVGNNLTASLSGTVLRIDGQAGGGGGGGGLGVVAWDEGAYVATGTVFNFVGTGVTTTASGTVVQVSVDSEPWLIDIWGTASDRFQTSGTWTIATYTDGGVTFYPTNIGLQSDGNQNSSVSWALAMSQGTWNTTIYCRKSTNTGIFTLNIDGSSIGTADTYAAAPAMGVFTITGTISATGKHTVQLKMATKNASSSGYFGEIFFVSFRRTA